MRLRIRKLQWTRRTVQIGVVVFMLAIPAIARYANYLSARELDKTLDRWEGTLQGGALVGIDYGFRCLPDGEMLRVDRMVRNRTTILAYTQKARGGPWSAEIAGVSMTDPLGAVESIAASKRSSGVLWLSLLIPVLATILLGRVFCSWLCPMNLFLEFTDKLRGLLKFLEVRPLDVKFGRGIKYAFLAVGIGLALILAVPVLGYVYPPAIIGREAHELVFGFFDRAEMGRFGFWAGGLTWMSLIILGIALFEVIVSRRWWCRYVCPGGALYILLGWIRPIRVRLKESNCTLCAACVPVCPAGLDPMHNQFGPECDNCGLCISHCDDDALSYTILGGSKSMSLPEATTPKPNMARRGNTEHNHVT